MPQISTMLMSASSSRYDIVGWFLRNQDYTRAVWLRSAPVAPTLCISNISVWCVISQMRLDSLKLSSGNWIGHGLGQRSATWNQMRFFFLRVQSKELCCFRKWFPWMSSVLTPDWSQHRWGRHYSSVDLVVCWSVKQSLKWWVTPEHHIRSLTQTSWLFKNMPFMGSLCKDR